MVSFGQDILGKAVILKFPENTPLKIKKKESLNFLKKNKNIESVFEKADKIKGRLRKMSLGFLAGKNNPEVLYNENGCRFIFNINDTYFSPRLASHRNELCDEIVKKITKKKNKILVMFAGVAPWPVILARKMKLAKKQGMIISSELNRKASKYAEKNVLLNKVQEYVKVIQGDSRKIYEKFDFKFDFIIMARPNLKETFLKDALKLCKKSTLVYYHGFGKKEEVLKEIKENIGKNIGKIHISKAGEIAPYKFRWICKFSIKSL
jgi:tRNA G37 N-methylase Trm5